ncbi:hypothetical protein A2866_04740 [Candidatus Roizmanbacteria bacterium RIFCSPHIGHO2_01_FULL_39_8]|uniref:Uncharacterized protein n=3 Tax=Candidatus Roizmaniibacteriota TaxID=1752723 RepID=A0A1F7GGT2_9BACT|nr:MAG: hypothetical protein A2866_04740 [Candidatus Roizmanbacteria bacterium RIFCSPHIGHO2_01_FULL_39_8]OGK28507.1 MAG: hypothetical protein A3C28_01920 [Candidatus Roizmanbacteria bacterium RIFCSPHIGHO2_02_FULL_39_9]OGK38181.1 MAG: hypothetical protein A3F60_03040 [Candidatus Roizmanbacteria bacterium RIFCSPHIGHO2_12_FULL_39_8]
MKPNKILIILIFLFSLITIPLGQKIWSNAPGMQPNSTQLLFFMGISFFEAMSFAAGICFLLFAWPLLKKVSKKSKDLVILTYLSIAWSLLSWWPHDRLHAHVGDNLDSLIWIEYSFHVSLIFAAVVIGYFFYTVILERNLK